MTNDDEDINPLSAFDEFGEAFDQNKDPLLELDEKFKEIDEDPIEVYKRVVIENSNITEQNKKERCRMLDDWKNYMYKRDRHPACPSLSHTVGFIEKLVAEGYVSKYVNMYIIQISKMFEYWNAHDRMPHGNITPAEFNPMESARKIKENDIKELPSSKKKKEYRLTIQEIGSKLRNIKNTLHKTVITTQFKYGLRAGQVCNIRIPDLQIDHQEINNIYPDMGSHPQLESIDDEAICFPSRSDRPGNKSERTILLPIDSELKTLLVKYLRIRPPIDDKWLFVNNGSGNKLITDYVTNAMWKPAFHPEYDGNEEFEPITSHYARHRFTTHWQTEVGINRPYLKYMRGDKQNNRNRDDSIDNYVHMYYEDVSGIYLSNIYRFDLI